MAITPRPRRKGTLPPPDLDWLRLSDENTPLPSAEDESLEEQAPDSAWPQLPNYEILGVLGRGGMGVVYKARHRELGRIVALKMLLAGAHSDGISLARFRTEGEAIARLQHPNIVQIFEVGSHNDLPYLALEYVQGGGLDDWIRHHQPTVEETASLVEIVARAVHTAHQRGIIHRDLKPANILLDHRGQPGGRGRDTEKVGKDTHKNQPLSGPATAPENPNLHRGSPALPPSLSEVIPKVADFGLAKRIEDTAGLTRSGAIIGTPAYMAPEQLGTRREGIGPATDVYALGVILYEMIAGRPPYEAVTPADILFQVTLRDPIPPRYWRPRLPFDLETICLKCLQKEPHLRYPSALALAEDLHRFLEHKPVLARPVSVFGRAGRWCRRHPVPTGLGLAVALLILITVGAFVQGFLSVQAEKHQKDLALKAAVVEEQKTRDALAREHRRREQLQEVLDVMTPALLERTLADGTDLTPVDRNALHQVAQLFREMGEESVLNPQEQSSAAVSFGHLARIHHRLNESGEAEPAYRKAIALFDALAAADPNNLYFRRSAGMNRIEFGRLLVTQKRLPDGMAFLHQGRAMMLQLLTEFPNDSLARQNLSVACTVLGGLFLEQGQVVEAEQAFCQSAILQARQLEERPNDLERRRAFAVHCTTLGQLQSRQNRLLGQENGLSFAIAVLLAKPANIPATAPYDELTAAMLNDLGILLMNLGDRRPEAEQHLLQAIRIRESLVARFPGMTAYAVGLGGSYTNLGSLNYYLGRGQPAVDWHKKAIGLLMPIFQNDSNNGQARLFYRNSLLNRAIAYDSLNRFSEAATDWESAARLSPIKDQHHMLAHQAESLVRAGDWKKGTTVATEVAAASDINPAILYRLAITFCRAAARQMEGKADRENFCQQALTLLHRAARAGLFRDAAWQHQLQQEEVFSLLRNRPEFRTIIGNPKE